MPASRPIARQIRSLRSWSYLVANTLVRFAIGLVDSAFRDPADAFGDTVHKWALGNMTCGFACEVRPHPPLPAPAVLIVNHQHFFDIQLLAALVPPPLFFVARVEVGRVPLIGSVLRRGGHILIARGSGPANEKAFDEAARRLASGGRVVFFGEGTRSKDGSIQTMRSGAFRLAARARVPLVPVVIAGTRSTFPTGYWPIVRARMAAAFLEPREVSEEQARSTAFRERVRGEMAGMLLSIAPGTGEIT